MTCTLRRDLHRYLATYGWMWKNEVSFQNLLDSVGKDEIWTLNFIHLEDTVILAAVRNIQKLLLETKKPFTLRYASQKAFIIDSSENEKQKVQHSERLIWMFREEKWYEKNVLWKSSYLHENNINMLAYTFSQWIKLSLHYVALHCEGQCLTLMFTHRRTSAWRFHEIQHGFYHWLPGRQILFFTVLLSSKEERVKGDKMFSTTQGNIFRHRIMMTWLWKKISFGPQLKVVKINGKLFQKVSDEELRGKLQLKSAVQQILYDRSAFSLLTSFYFPLKQTILKSGFFTLPECCTHVLRHKSKLPPTKKTHKAVH